MYRLQSPCLSVISGLCSTRDLTHGFMHVGKQYWVAILVLFSLNSLLPLVHSACLVQMISSLWLSLMSQILMVIFVSLLFLINIEKNSMFFYIFYTFWELHFEYYYVVSKQWFWIIPLKACSCFDNVVLSCNISEVAIVIILRQEIYCVYWS